MLATFLTGWLIVAAAVFVTAIAHNGAEAALGGLVLVAIGPVLPAMAVIDTALSGSALSALGLGTYAALPLIFIWPPRRLGARGTIALSCVAAAWWLVVGFFLCGLQFVRM